MFLLEGDNLSLVKFRRKCCSCCSCLLAWYFVFFLVFIFFLLLGLSDLGLSSMALPVFWFARLRWMTVASIVRLRGCLYLSFVFDRNLSGVNVRVCLLAGFLEVFWRVFAVVARFLEVFASFLLARITVP